MLLATVCKWLGVVKMVVYPRARDLPDHLREGLRLYGKFNANVDRRLPPMDYPLSHRRVLMELFERPGQVDVEVALSLGMDRTFLSRTVGALIRDGLITHVAGEKHRGQRHLRLSDDGHRLASQCLEEHREAIKAEFIASESEEQTQLMAVLSLHLPSDLTPIGEPQIYIRPSKSAEYIWLMSEQIRLKANAIDEALSTAALAVGQSLANRPDVDLRLTALQHEKPVGMCLSSIAPNQIELTLGAVYVAPQARMQGIASQLLERTITTATKHTYSKIRAIAGSEEVSFNHLLKKHGFARKRGAERMIRYGTYQNVFQWVKSLPII